MKLHENVWVPLPDKNMELVDQRGRSKADQTALQFRPNPMKNNQNPSPPTR